MGTNLGYFDNWLYGIIGDHMIEMHKARVVATASAMGGVEAKDAAAEALYVKSLPDMMTAVKRDEVIAEWRRARKAQNAALAAAAADDMILAGPPLAVGASTATLSTGTVPSPLHLPSGPTTAHVQSERRLLVDARVPAPVNAHVRVGPPAAAAPPSPDAMLMAGLSDSAIARFIVATADARDGAAPATAAIPVISSATTAMVGPATVSCSSATTAAADGCAAVAVDGKSGTVIKPAAPANAKADVSPDRMWMCRWCGDAELGKGEAEDIASRLRHWARCPRRVFRCPFPDCKKVHPCLLLFHLRLAT